VGGAGPVAMNLYARQGVAVREFIMATGHGRADYLLFVDQKAVGAIEAKPSGTPWPVSSRSRQSTQTDFRRISSVGDAVAILYEATGDETMFTDGFDPHPRSRPVLRSIVPKTLADGCGQWRDDADGGSLRSRLQRLDTVPRMGFVARWKPTASRAVDEGESARALAQMATGSGKTFMAANLASRLVQQADAERVLFLVDRAKLGRQTLREGSSSFRALRRWSQVTDLYNVQWLTSNRIDPGGTGGDHDRATLYSMLRARRSCRRTSTRNLVGDRTRARRVATTRRSRSRPSTW